MRQLFAFVKDHLVPVAGLALAAICWMYGVVSGAGEIAAIVLSPMQWQLIGGGLVLVSLVSILIQWHGAKTATPTIEPTKALAPAHAMTSHNQSGGITAHTVNQALTPESNDRFDKLYAVYKAAEEFRRKACTTGLNGEDIVNFYDVIKEAYFLFDDNLASYLENEILAKGNEIYSLDNIDAVQDRAERSRLVHRRRELTEWMRMERNALRERFAPFLNPKPTTEPLDQDLHARPMPPCTRS